MSVDIGPGAGYAGGARTLTDRCLTILAGCRLLSGSHLRTPPRITVRRTVAAGVSRAGAFLPMVPGGAKSKWDRRREGNLYSPKVPEEFIPRLWRLARAHGRPMTHLVRDAVSSI